MDNMNVTNNSLPSHKPVIFIAEPRISHHIRIILYIVVFLLSLLGNYVVIQAICRVPAKKPLGYVLVTNLATAELGNTVLFTFHVAYEEMKRNWVFGNFLCKVIFPLQIVCFTAVGYTLVSIAVYRWRVIASPCTRKVLSKVQTQILIFFTWMLGVVAALPSLITRQARESRQYGKTFCEEVWPSPVHLHTYTIAYMVIVVFTPTVVIITSYSLVALKLHQHIIKNKKRAQREERDSLVTSMTDLKLTEFRATRPERNDKPVVTMAVDVFKGGTNQTQEHRLTDKSFARQVSTKGHSEGPTQERPEGGRGIVELEHDLLKMIYIIVFISVVCYLPFQVIFLLWEFATDMVEGWKYAAIVTRYCIWLSLLPSALHPLCYGTMSKFYAKVFAKLVSCR